jgi:hypothetical protein
MVGGRPPTKDPGPPPIALGVIDQPLCRGLDLVSFFLLLFIYLFFEKKN